MTGGYPGRSTRRAFIGVLSGAAAWPLRLSAQHLTKFPTVGYLGSSTASAQRPWVAAFGQRLHQLGWIEGRTLAKQVTAAIPIVFAVASDPVGNGLVESLPRPGRNITGLSIQQVDLAAKKLELLHEIVPKLRRIAVLANIANPAGALEMSAVKSAARSLDLEYVPTEIRRAEDIAPAFDGLTARAEVLYVCGDALVTNNRTRIITLALGTRLPAMFPSREHVEAGGLMSYGPSFPDMHRRFAEHVDKILRGAKPGDIPVEQPTKFDLVLNLTTAKALGLEVPATLLARADEVIE